MSQEMKFSYIEAAAFTDPGLVREENEDAFACLGAEGCFLVSDGMGGGSAGEIASQIVEESVSDAMVDSGDDSPGGRKYAVQQALHRANQTIQEYARAHSYAQMGATLVLFLADSWDPSRAWLCHVGDSRIYLLREGELSLLTRDHTLGTELEGKKRTVFTDHTKSPLSHILTRSIGVAGKVLPEWREIEVRPDDLFLLCSDGVSTMLSDDEICGELIGSAPLEERISALSAAVREAGAKDNYTIVLCRIAPVLPEPEIHADEEKSESAYLLKISEERIDHA